MSKRFYNCEGVPDNTEVTLSVSSRRSPVTTSSGNSSPVLQNLALALPLSQACNGKKSMTHHLPQTPPLQRTRFFDGEATRVAYFLSCYVLPTEVELVTGRSAGG